MSAIATAEDDDPFRALRGVAELRRQAARIEATQVRRARATGMPWAQIAAALGISERAVRRRYGTRALLRRRTARR